MSTRTPSGLMQVVTSLSEALHRAFAPLPTKPSGMADEAECPRSHSDMEEYPCLECGADV